MHAILAAIRLRPAVAAAALLAMLSSSPAQADLVPLVRRLDAVPGAPLLVPVRVDGAMRLPKVTLEVKGARPAACAAEVAWPVSIVELAGVGRWATATNPTRLERTRPPGATDAFLLVELPDVSGDVADLLLDGRRVRLDLHAPADDGFLQRLATRSSRLAPAGSPDPRLTLPDPDAPFERFRASIGAALHGWTESPPFPVDSLDARAAESTTALWLAALARIARGSEGVATEVAETLVATCADVSAPAPIAAWLAAPSEVAALLALALDPARIPDASAERSSADARAAAEAVASWLRVRSPLLAWIDDESAEGIVLALANPSSSEEVVRLQWILTDDPPLAAIVPPAEVLRVRLARPRGAAIDGVPIRDGRVERLRIENRERVLAFDVAPPSVPAGPAGQAFVLQAPPLDLVAVASASPRRGVPAPATVASLRPRLDGWEIFVEARTGGSGEAEDAPSEAEDAPSEAPSDAVEIIGPRGEIVTIAADGSIDDPVGVLSDGTPVVFRRFRDRYRAAFRVPPAWIDRGDGRTIVELGFRRRIGASGASFDAPAAATPWRVAPRTIAIDLYANSGGA